MWAHVSSSNLCAHMLCANSCMCMRLQGADDAICSAPQGRRTIRSCQIFEHCAHVPATHCDVALPKEVMKHAQACYSVMHTGTFLVVCSRMLHMCTPMRKSTVDGCNQGRRGAGQRAWARGNGSSIVSPCVAPWPDVCLL